MRHTDGFRKLYLRQLQFFPAVSKIPPKEITKFLGLHDHVSDCMFSTKFVNPVPAALRRLGPPGPARPRRPPGGSIRFPLFPKETV